MEEAERASAIQKITGVLADMGEMDVDNKTHLDSRIRCKSHPGFPIQPESPAGSRPPR
jgi:hypothetical protein